MKKVWVPGRKHFVGKWCYEMHYCQTFESNIWLGLKTEIYLHDKGGRSGDNCKIKHMIQLSNAENQETADRTTQDSLKMQGLLEADNVPGTEEWETQFCLYREFCVLNVVGKSTMKKMGENYAWGIRESYYALPGR